MSDPTVEWRQIKEFYHKPAAPAQVRQAHTLQGLVAATARAALTCRGLRAILVCLHRIYRIWAAFGDLEVWSRLRELELKRACEMDVPCMPRVLKIVLLHRQLGGKMQHRTGGSKLTECCHSVSNGDHATGCSQDASTGCVKVLNVRADLDNRLTA